MKRLDRIYRFLLTQKLNTGLRGFPYVARAIQYKLENPIKYNKMVTIIARVAKEEKTTIDGVERCFTHLCKTTDGSVTVKTFINRLYYKYLYEYKENIHEQNIEASTPSN